jgi:prophage antirepressor-like protein
MFYLDIWNNVLELNSNKIFIIFDNNGEIWFGLKDVFRSLGYTSLKKAVYKINIPKEYICKYEDINKTNIILQENISNIQPKTKMVNEFGFNYVLTKSNKTIAKEFMNKYINDIMIQIRKTGKYISSQEDINKIKKINIKLNKIKKDNNILLQNQSNIIYPDGEHIYIIQQEYNDKIFYKVGYTKNLNSRIKVYNTGNINKIRFKYIIPIIDENIDKCIKKIMKNKEWIKNKEYYKISLKKALLFILECDNNIKNILCGKCLKKYTFNKILLHKC